MGGGGGGGGGGFCHIQCFDQLLRNIEIKHFLYSGNIYINSKYIFLGKMGGNYIKCSNM